MSGTTIEIDNTETRSWQGNWRWWLMTLLVVAGIGVSGYLAWSHLMNQEIVCGQSQGCDIVDQSLYSEFIIWNIPVSVMGLLSYLTMFLLLVLRGRTLRKWDSYFPLAVLGISLSGVMFSLYLTYMELFVILGVCKWCVTSATILALIFILSIVELRTVTV